MLDQVTGTVAHVAADAAVVSVGDVALRIQMPTRDLATLEGRVTLHTVLLIKDENLTLFGFRALRDRELFHALTGVSGVGPKLALAVLSFHAPDALERAIVTDDAGALSLVPGVGKKTAGRIVLELRDAFDAAAPEAEAPLGSAVAEVREALKGMGFSAPEVREALAGLPADGDAPTLLRHALKTLGAPEPAGADA